jgi:hypothetical protein
MQSLVVTQHGQKILSKQQIQFNKLLKQIEKSKMELNNLKNTLDIILSIHATEVNPKAIELANERFVFLQKLDAAVSEYKFNENQLEIIASVFIAIFEDIFEVMVATPEQEALYDKWSDETYQSEVNEQNEIATEMLKEYIKSMGIEVDFEDIDTKNPDEALARLQQKIQEKKIEQANHKQEQQKQKKKTKKQIQKEEETSKLEEIKNKSLRDIYIGLVKLLHPDTETNEDIKIEKEEVLKKVTQAYEKKDLVTLLSLEIEWIHRNNNHLQELKDETLALYNVALKEQIQSIQQERFQTLHHPKYESIGQYSYSSLFIAKKELKKSIKDNEKEISDYKLRATQLEMFKINKSKLIAYINILDDDLTEDGDYYGSILNFI